MTGQGKLDPGHLRFFLAGNTSLDRERECPETDGSWLTDKMWGDVLAIGKLPGFDGFVDFIVKPRLAGPSFKSDHICRKKRPLEER